ncbi:MAG: citrate/2-methylcitrate synthase, partial [Arenimonas sp.]
MFPTLDWYSASAYHMMGTLTSRSMLVLVMAHTFGCPVHMIEQCDDGRMLRPGASCSGVDDRPGIDFARR